MDKSMKKRMKKSVLIPVGKKLLYTLIGGSFLFCGSAYAADEMPPAQPPAQETAQGTAAGDAKQREFTLEKVEVTADKDKKKEKKDDGYVAKRTSVGTKTDTPLNETAQSVSVVTKQQLEARAVQNVDQAIAYAPGITSSIFGTDARGYNSTAIRGFYTGVGAIFTDGLHSPRGWFATAYTDTYGLDRIEILRGPASILYGANSPGGLINQVTKQPPETELHEIQLQAGNRANKGLALDIGGPARADGKLLFRLTARLQDQDFEADYTSGKNTFIAPALTWKPNDATSLTLLANYQKNENVGGYEGNRSYYAFYSPSSILSGHGYPSTLFLGEPGYDSFKREQKEIGYLFEHQFNPIWSVKQTARHTDVDLAMKWLDYTTLDSDGRTLHRVATNHAENLTADTIDTHFQAKWSNGSWAHTSLIGFDYSRRSYDYREGDGPAPDLDLITRNYGQTVIAPDVLPNQLSHMRQRGVYLQDQAKWGDRWVFMAGGRRDWYEDDLGSIKQAANSGRAGVVYHATKELSPYVSYATSFEPQSGTDRYGKAFVPTTGTQYELGVQYEPTGSQSRFTAAVFDLRQQNVLTSDPLNTAAESYSVQTGEVASKGLELEGNWTTPGGVNLIANYTLLDNQTTKSNDPSTLGLRGAGVSKHSAGVWADYTVPAGKWKGLGFGGGVRYLGSRYNDANTEKYPDVVVADAMVRYDLKPWQLALNVRNLFDKFYTVSGYAVAEGRTALLTATRRW